MQYNIGDKVYSIVLGGNHKWMLHETTINKITITKSGVSYHLKNNSDIRGSYIYYKGNKKPIFKDRHDAELLLNEINKHDDDYQMTENELNEQMFGVNNYDCEGGNYEDN